VQESVWAWSTGCDVIALLLLLRVSVN